MSIIITISVTINKIRFLFHGNSRVLAFSIFWKNLQHGCPALDWEKSVLKSKHFCLNNGIRGARIQWEQVWVDHLIFWYALRWNSHFLKRLEKIRLARVLFTINSLLNLTILDQKLIWIHQEVNIFIWRDTATILCWTLVCLRLFLDKMLMELLKTHFL